MPYTHSLPAALLWSAAALLGAALWLRTLRPALAIGLAVGSHWCLDLIVHRRDLPLWGDSHKVGLALWNHPAAALTVELSLLLGAAAVLLRSQALGPERRRAFLWFTGALVAAQLGFLVGPSPPGPTPLMLTALACFGGAAWWSSRVEAPALHATGADRPPRVSQGL
jgi:hypothetical protein